MPVVYSTADDYEYLKSFEEWRERMLVRLQLLFRTVKTPVGGNEASESEVLVLSHEEYIDHILSGLDVMVAELKNPAKKKSIRSNLVGRGALYTYLIDKDLPADLNSEQKKEIESVFFATYIRTLIVEKYEQNPDLIGQYAEERAEFHVRLVNQYEKVQVDHNDGIEMVYLYRFERAVLYLFEITHKIEIKLSLKVGNLLEGCPDNKRYIIGGRSAKDTMRRLALIDAIVQIKLPEDTIAKKRKEKRKLELEEEETGEGNDGVKLTNGLTISPSLLGLSSDKQQPSLISSSSKKQKVKEADLMKYATAASTSKSMSSKTEPLVDVISALLEIEKDPNLVFVDYNLLTENPMKRFEMNYSKELDSGKIQQNATSASTFQELTKDKKDYPYHVPKSQHEKKENLPFQYEFAVNSKYGFRRLLKVFPFDQLSKTHEDQLRSEKSILKLLNSESKYPNIIRYCDWSMAMPQMNDRMNYLILEPMDLTLEDYFKEVIQTSTGTVKDQKILVVMKDIASAVYSLHSQLMVHRTLRIDKFMVKLSGDRAIVKLCDLSSVIVLPHSRHYTQYTEQISNLSSQITESVKYPEYLLDFTEMAPEFSQKISVKDGDLLSLEMDLWSLGKIFYFLNTATQLKWRNNETVWKEGIAASFASKSPSVNEIIQGLLKVSPEERKAMSVKRVIDLLAKDNQL